MFRLMAGLALLTLTPAQEPASTVAGLVKFEGKHEPRRINDRIDKDRHGGPHRDGQDVFDESAVVGPKGELANVLVRVKGSVKGEFPAPKDPVVLNALDYQFRPRIYVARPGQTLQLKNSGFNMFNFHAVTRRNREFNVGIARGHTHEVTLTEPEIGIKVQHDCCPWQIAWIHVIEHPFFAVTGVDGKFQIKGLPAGTYVLEAWHEKFGARAATVTVDGKGALTHDFAFEGK